MGRVVCKAEVLIVQYSPIRVLLAWVAVIISRLTLPRRNCLNLVHGVDDPLETNVLNHISTLQLGPQARLPEKRFDRVLANSISEAKIALRPYGYYAAGNYRRACTYAARHRQ